MATFSEDFTGTEGNNLANGWASDATFGGSSPLPKYRSNRGSTSSATGQHAAWKLHGLTVSGDWQLDFDCDAPLAIGEGGVAVLVVSNTTFQGWAVFIGNAVHIQRYNSGGSHDNLTNIDRPGSTGNLSNHVTFTRRDSDGFMQVLLDGSSFATATDTSHDAGNMVLFSVQNTNSPTLETWIDNLVLKDSISSATSTNVLRSRARHVMLTR